jgi:hypothetical protein
MFGNGSILDFTLDIGIFAFKYLHVYVKPKLLALLALVNIINFFVDSTGVWTQGSMLASQVLYCSTPAHFALFWR